MIRDILRLPTARVRQGLAGRPLRFAVAGGLNTVFGLAIYPLLLWSVPWLHTHFMVGLGIAQVLSVLFAFIIYKRVVFRSQGNLLRELAAFLSFYGLNYALNWLALPVLVATTHLGPIIAQFIFALVLMACGFFWHSRITFRPAKDPR